MADENTPTTGTTKTAASRSGAAAGGSSPDEQLKKLKEVIEKGKTDAEKLKKQIAEDQGKYDTLEKALAQRSQVSAAFDAAVQGVTADRLEIQDFVANQLPQLEKQDEVKSKKAEIDEIVNKVDSKIQTNETDWEKLKQKSKEETTALQTAQDDLARKKAELDKLQNLQRAVQDKFNELRKLSQRMKTEGAGKPLVKYVLARELKAAWEQPETKELLTMTKEELQTRFYAKSEEVRSATDAVTEQGRKQKDAQAALESARTVLDKSKAGRLDDIVKQVGALVPSAPAYTAAAAGAGVSAGAAAAASPA